jgi:metal-responsive CopG/Arc/MetJ family transcriptional regulator
MAASKIAITIEQSMLSRLDRLVRERKYPNRSRAIQEALEEKMEKIEHRRLIEECAKLDPKDEQSLAEEGMGFEVEQWPEY